MKLNFFSIVLIASFFITACGAPAAVPPTPAATATPSSGKWITKTETSSFDDSQTVILSLFAEKKIQAWLDEPLPILSVRCKEGRLDVLVGVGTQLEVESLNDQSTVRIRFDKDEAKRITMNHSTDGDSLFFIKPEEILPQLLAHETLLFGFTPFNAPPVETSFDLRGLNEVVQPLQEACP